MKREKIYRITIVTLSVLLATAIGILAFMIIKGAVSNTVDSSSSSGNLISPPDVTTPFSESPPSIKYVSRELLSASPKADEKIRLPEEGEEKALPFIAKNILPGDSVSKTFSVSVADESAETLSFSANVTSGSVPGNKFTITIKAGQTLLYSGPIAQISEKKYSISAPCDVNYLITVALDKTAGNEYSDISIEMDFTWSFEYEEYAPVSVTYSDGILGKAFKSQTSTVKIGDATPSFSGTPEREGYVFTGWYPEIKPTVTENVTYTAQWGVEVVFVSNGKTERKIVDEGYTVEKPSVPEKASCGFAGWYLDSKYTEKYNFDSPLKSGVTLYARFFLFGDVDGNGVITAADADLIGLYVMEAENDNIRNIMAGRVSALSGSVTANDANNIVRYVMEDIDEFAVVDLAKGCEYDIENNRIILPEKE